MDQRTSSRIAYLILAIGFIAGIVVILSTQNSFGGGDHFEHYKLAHWGWKYPKLLFNHWGKPVFTLLISPMAQFGINGARMYNLLMGLLTALTVYRLAVLLKIKNSLLSLFLVVFTPVYFILMFTALTEVSFSFFLALTTLLFFKEKYLWSAVVLSFLPLVRTEGIVLFPLFILAYGLKKKFLTIPLLTVGFWVISLLGYPFYNNFLWLITEMPYSGSAKDIYGSGSLWHFVNYQDQILGSIISALFILGVVLSVADWGMKNKFKLGNSFYFLLLVPGSFLVFFAAHSYVWWQGMGNSLGLIRVIGSVLPFASLTALIGFNFVYYWIQRVNKYIAWLAMLISVFFIVKIGIKTHEYGFSISKPQALLNEAANYIKANQLDLHKVYYFNAYVIVELGLNPFDQSIAGLGIPNQLQPSISMPDSSIIVWDAHFGPNEGRTPLERLKNDDGLVLVKSFHPIQPFKVLGGYDYGVYIFQKRLNQKKSKSNVEGLIEEYHLDFEESDNDTSVIAHSGEKSLSVLSGQAYINLIEMPVIQLAPQRQPIKIEVTGAVYAATNIKNSSPALVCSMDDSGDNLMYEAFKPAPEKVGAWDMFSHIFNIYVIPSNTAHLKLYLWNKDQATFNLDDVYIKISELDPGK